ncbi:hypothetical protein BaRGS_00012717 [Batillaria attramentaria]|uniref:Uncharacterized protein n=1 Tax=Batillaria attramentaria TaxID=370345 RepID=A0ABD0L8Y3_9CAEN
MQAVEEEDTDYSESSAPPRRGLIGFIEKLRHPEASFWPIKKHHATFKSCTGGILGGLVDSGGLLDIRFSQGNHFGCTDCLLPFFFSLASGATADRGTFTAPCSLNVHGYQDNRR